MRVQRENVGERMYAINECASCPRNNLLDIYDAIPVLVHNLYNDLLAYEYRMRDTYIPILLTTRGLGPRFNPLPTVSNHSFIGRY